MKLAFYKGKGTWYDKIIRMWTRSKYSHVELVIGSTWYTSSPRTGGVRARYITPKPANWDYVEIEGDIPYITSFYQHTKGAEYDWAGIIFSQILPFGRHIADKWTCSEWCASALGYAKPNSFSPEDLYRRVT